MPKLTLEALASATASALLLASCASAPPPEPPAPPPPPYSVEVLSEPVGAAVSFRGRPMGTTPLSFRVGSEKELVDVGAARPEQAVMEKRIRFVSPDSAQVFFQFGRQPSALAKKLGLSRVLVLETSERISFDSGQSVLKPEGIPVLKREASILKTFFPTVDVFVCGHTDSTGSDRLNLKLSLERARSAAAVLEREGVPRERMRIEGFGKEFPLESNDTPAGRAVNRRTEFVLPE